MLKASRSKTEEDFALCTLPNNTHKRPRGEHKASSLPRNNNYRTMNDNDPLRLTTTYNIIKPSVKL